MIRVGLGVTVFARGKATNSVDGIGAYTSALWNRLATREDVQCIPFSYGWSLPDSLKGPHDHQYRNSYSSLVACSVLLGTTFPDSRRLAKQVELIHAPDHLIPKFDDVPVVATIMDTIPLSHPEWFSDRLRVVKNAIWRRSACWADRIITISEYSKSEIVRQFNVPDHRIHVIPLGVDQYWFSSIASGDIKEVQAKFQLPDRYFIFVGTLQPRKNLMRVIEAFRMLPQGVSSQCPLVIIGNVGRSGESLAQDLREHRFGEHVRWLGRISDSDLLPIMKSACALVFPSLCEGFGLPVLEAFAAGVPVIASDSSALPEIVGDAGLLVDPTRVEEIADSMSRIVSDDVLAESLICKGRQRAAQFTWEQTVLSTVEVYKDVVSRMNNE